MPVPPMENLHFYSTEFIPVYAFYYIPFFSGMQGICEKIHNFLSILRIYGNISESSRSSSSNNSFAGILFCFYPPGGNVVGFAHGGEGHCIWFLVFPVRPPEQTRQLFAYTYKFHIVLTMEKKGGHISATPCPYRQAILYTHRKFRSYTLSLAKVRLTDS